MADPDTESKPVDQKTLVADIDRTRAELARTIDAISDRVNPAKNVQRAADQLRERADQISISLRERADQITNDLRERADQVNINPVMVGAAAAAIVVGVTVLLLFRRRKR
jgi:hypothetical protein